MKNLAGTGVLDGPYEKNYSHCVPPNSLPCELTPDDRSPGDPIIGEGDRCYNGGGVVKE